MPSNPAVIFWSLIHLRPSMIYWRIHRTVKGYLIRLIEQLGLAPRLFHRVLGEIAVSPVPRLGSRYHCEEISLRERRFSFLQESLLLPANPADVREAVARLPLLWQFHFGYHDYLLALLEDTEEALHIGLYGADAPGADAPGADAPGADAPGADAPGGDAPGADAPGADALRTDVSGSALPDTQEALKATAEEILAFMTEWNRIFPLHAAGARTSAWHPYVLSIRIETWIRLMTRLQECGIPPDEPRMREINHGVERMTRVLLRNLEKGTMANHLLRNIKALVLAGLFLNTEIGAQSRRVGLKLLERELREQVLADGCHFERSPMYHVSVLNDVLDMTEAIMLAGSTVPEILSETAGRMTGFLERMRHTDGEIPYFNDSTGSFILRTEEVLQRGRILCHELECAVDGDMPFATEVSPARTSGLLTAGTTRSWIVFDAGNVGPDYQPGHAHCDTLSLEWSLDGQRVITDTGVFHYRESPERHYSRSTAAHSTIIVDGMEQSEVWKSFRVGRRAKILRFAQESQEGMTVLRGAHDGYRRLRSPVIHERAVVMAGEAWIAVIDWLHGRGEHSIRSHMHFHPVVRVADPVADPVAVDNHWHTRISVGETIIAFHATGFHRTERLETEYYPAFGERRMRQTLRMDARIMLPHMTAVVYGIECEGNPIRLRAEELVAEISASDGHPFLLGAMGWK